MSEREVKTSPQSGCSKWKKSRFANLRIYTPTGVFYLHAKVNGGLIRQSLETTSETIAVIKRDNLLAERRRELPVVRGQSTFKDVSIRYLAAVSNDQNIKSSTKHYREEIVKAIRVSWPGINEVDLGSVSRQQFKLWADSYSRHYGATRFNGTLQTWSAIFKEAGSKDLVKICEIKPRKVRPKKPKLPAQSEFKAVLKLMRERESRFPHTADLALLLAVSGMRISEADRVQVEHIDFKKEQLAVVGDPETFTKNGEVRYVPMNVELKNLLKRLVGNRSNGKLLPISNCRYSLREACRIVGCTILTPHDLRDLFATRCIESGVDIPTVARWLGHKDGGALLMKTYSHLRDEHSAEMAKRVKF